jgi:predicted hydrocarbon binding protein
MSQMQALGKSINAILDAFVSKQLAEEIVAESFGTIIQPNSFYPVESFLEALAKIEDEYGELVLRSIGKKMMSNAEWPQNVNDLESVLQSINAAYQMNTRPNDPSIIGSYKFQKISDKSFTITCDNPYPCVFDEGIITGAAKAFDKKARISHKEGSCRKNGNRHCVYEISIY